MEKSQRARSRTACPAGEILMALAALFWAVRKASGCCYPLAEPLLRGAGWQ